MPLVNQSYAACSLAKPGDCIKYPGSIGESQRLGRYEVNVKNLCARPIWVAVHYKDYDREPNGSSCLGGGSSCTSGWITKGWWKLNIGETKYIANTRNRIIYFSGHSEDRRFNWGYSDRLYKVNGKSEKFFEATMTNSFSNWTQTFKCS